MAYQGMNFNEHLNESIHVDRRGQAINPVLEGMSGGNSNPTLNNPFKVPQAIERRPKRGTAGRNRSHSQSQGNANQISPWEYPYNNQCCNEIALQAQQANVWNNLTPNVNIAQILKQEQINLYLSSMQQTIPQQMLYRMASRNAPQVAPTVQMNQWEESSSDNFLQPNGNKYIFPWATTPQGFNQTPSVQQTNGFPSPFVGSCNWATAPQQNNYQNNPNAFNLSQANNYYQPWENQNYLQNPQPPIQLRQEATSWSNANLIQQPKNNYLQAQTPFNRLPPVWEKDIPKSFSFDDMLDSDSDIWKTLSNDFHCDPGSQATKYRYDSQLQDLPMSATLPQLPSGSTSKGYSAESSYRRSGISESQRAFKRESFTPAPWPNDTESPCRRNVNSETKRTFIRESTPAPWSNEAESPYRRSGNYSTQRTFTRESTPAPWSNEAESPYRRSGNSSTQRTFKRESTPAPWSNDTESPSRSANIETPRTFRRDSTPAPWSSNDSKRKRTSPSRNVKRRGQRETTLSLCNDRRKGTREEITSLDSSVVAMESTQQPWSGVQSTSVRNNDLMSLSKVRVRDDNSNICDFKSYNCNFQDIERNQPFLGFESTAFQGFPKVPANKEDIKQVSASLDVAFKTLDDDIIKEELFKIVEEQLKGEESGDASQDSKVIQSNEPPTDVGKFQAPLDVKFHDSFETMKKFLTEEEISFMEGLQSFT